MGTAKKAMVSANAIATHALPLQLPHAHVHPGGSRMHMLTPREVKEAFGEIDDLTVAEIVATGATAQDLAEAPAGMTNDEALANAGRALADECLRLAGAASTKQDHDRHLAAALVGLRAAAAYGNVSLLPSAPTLSPVIEGATENDPASAEANDVRLSAETEILTKVIEESPEGSLLTYSADQLGVLFSVAEPVVPGTEAYAEIERLAQAHQCSLRFAVGTVTFTKGSYPQTKDREMFGKSKDKYENMLLAGEKTLVARFASALEAIGHATSDSTVENDLVPFSQEQHSEEPALTDPTSSISRGVTVVGKIFGEGTVQLFGRIEGEVRASTVLIEEGAQVEGDVVAEELIIAGQVKGTIHANRVKLDSTAVVEGDIFHRSLSIDENARFEGLSKREDSAGDMQRSPLSRSSTQGDRQTNVTAIDAIDRVQRAVDSASVH